MLIVNTDHGFYLENMAGGERQTCQFTMKLHIHRYSSMIQDVRIWQEKKRNSYRSDN